MKKKLGNFMLITVFIVGMIILLYPYISNYIAQRNVVEGSIAYDQTVQEMSQEEIVEAWRQAEIYNENLKGDPVHDPFVAGSGTALPENYTSVLNIGDGIMAYVSIPVIGVYLPIRHGTSDEVLSESVGHIEQTMLPIGGEGSHCVLTAHTGYTKAELFTHLTEVKEGDKFLLYVLDRTLTYQVDQIQIILPEEIDQLRPVEGEDYVTLVTCTPYGVNSHRLLVRGTRIPNDEVIHDNSRQVAFPWRIVIIAGICLLILLLIIYLAHRSQKRINK